MRRRALVARTLVAAGPLTLLPAARAAGEATLALPQPELGGSLPLEQALARRRSVRSYAPAPIALAAVAQLLWAAQGITGPGGLRTAPSAGALHPLELHLAAQRVEGLAPGVYRYLVGAHALRLTVDGPAAAALRRAALDQPAVGDAAAVLVIAAVEARSAGRYGARARRYVAFEAGAAAQNVALQAVALGLAAVVVGAFDDAAVAAALQLAADEQPLALMPLGRPA